jgi:uncharacterized membrane protein
VVKLKEILIDLHSSFWFVPSLMVLASILFALGVLEVDNRYATSLYNDWPRLFGAGPDSSRGMLSTIASSMISMMTVVFSMTLVTLALASSQYTSRIMRNFMRSRTTQVVLGMFAGIFTYCLIVLRTIRSGEGEEYIPSLAVVAAVALAVIGVGVLVFFIHHIASSIQASNIVGSVADETILTISKLFPEEMGEGKEDSDENDISPYAKPIHVDKSGYIQNIGEQTLFDLACKWNTIIKMNYGIGDFVVIGMPLVFVTDNLDVTHEMEIKLLEAFSIRRYRTIEQDPLFGIRQIVDVAMKALSPGINDTTTAILSINYLTAILANLSHRKIPSNYRYSEKKLRVIAKAPNFEKFLHESYDQIRSNAKGNVAVIKDLLFSIEVLTQLNRSPIRRHLLSKVADNINEVLNDSIKLTCEKHELNQSFYDVKDRFRYF